MMINKIAMLKSGHTGFLLATLVVAIYITSCRNEQQEEKPRYINTRILTPGLYVEKYCTHESGAGIYDTGTDYDFYLTDSAGHKQYIGWRDDDHFFDLLLRDNRVFIKKICEYGDLYDSGKNMNYNKVVDSAVYDLQALGFKIPLLTPVTASRKATAIKKISMEMILVKGAVFDMGSEWTFDQMPVHQVSVSDFYINKYEVTQDLWEAVMGYNPSCFRNCPACPVESVNWNEVQLFLQELNRITGDKYRLPTEAEWEYAASGGNKQKDYRYCGGNNMDSVAWYDENSGGKTHPVGQKFPNELGLCDMSGNVSEWCNDWYGDDYKTACNVFLNPPGIDAGTDKVIRGGGWNASIYDTRPADRQRGDPEWGHGYNRGFRLVKSF
jgi:formylglycine-generating enzyme required for sulfatase activity